MSKALGWRIRWYAIITVVVMVVGGVGGTLFRNDVEATQDDDAAAAAVQLGVENVHVVSEGTIESGPSISGSLQLETKASVRAEVAGVVLATNVDIGQSVQRGQVLGRIDDAAIRDGYASAQSAVRAAESAAQVARRNVERMESLVKAGAVAERAVEDARAAALGSERMLADAKTALAQAEKMLSKTVLRAPFTGVIAERAANAGDVVQPGMAMFTVVDPSSMQLEATVPSEQLAEVRVGATVSFRVNGYAQSFTGRVARISPVADPVTRQVLVFVSIPNEQNRLVGGLFAEGQIATESQRGLIAPVSALQLVPTRGDDAADALRVKNGVVERVEVRVGVRDSRSEVIQIVSGVAAGDTLLLGAARTVTAGTPVVVTARTN
jgi:membrane fusion protein (multidrug efflux system)